MGPWGVFEQNWLHEQQNKWVLYVHYKSTKKGFSRRGRTFVINFLSPADVAWRVKNKIWNLCARYTRRVSCFSLLRDPIHLLELYITVELESGDSSRQENKRNMIILLKVQAWAEQRMKGNDESCKWKAVNFNSNFHFNYFDCVHV